MATWEKFQWSLSFPSVRPNYSIRISRTFTWRWENERFKSDVRSILQTKFHSFFCGCEYTKHRVAQIVFVDRFNPESMSVCHDFIRFLRDAWGNGSWIERWKLSSGEVSKSYVYLKLFCEMRSSYCTYHNSSRTLRPWAHNCYICKIFPFFIHCPTRICRHFDRIAHACAILSQISNSVCADQHAETSVIKFCHWNKMLLLHESSETSKLILFLEQQLLSNPKLEEWLIFWPTRGTSPAAIIMSRSEQTWKFKRTLLHNEEPCRA